MNQQEKILRELMWSGKATAKELSARTGKTTWQIHSIGKHLINRGLAKKKTIGFYDWDRRIPSRETTFYPNTKNLRRVRRVLQSAEQ